MLLIHYPIEFFLSLIHPFIHPSMVSANAQSAPQYINHPPSSIFQIPILSLQSINQSIARSLASPNPNQSINQSLALSLPQIPFIHSFVSITPMPPKQKNQNKTKKSVTAPKSLPPSYSHPLQNILQNPLLLRRQSRRELNIILDDEITPRIRLLT
jgi:hypothetical protein